MEELNIKCNNINEAKFIEKWFLNNYCIWSYNSRTSYKNLDIEKYPIIIYNIDITIYFARFYKYSYENNKIIEAKHIMREEKLKRLWKNLI